MEKSYDVIVIGAGAVGVSTAIHLQRKGKRVLLVDKKGAGQGTSYGNAGVVDSTYVLPYGPPPLSEIPGMMMGQSTDALINVPYALNNLPWILDFYCKSTQENKFRNAEKLRPIIENAVGEHKNLIKGTKAEKYFLNTGRIKIYRSEAAFQNASRERELFEYFNVPYEVLAKEQVIKRQPYLKPNFYNGVLTSSSCRYTSPGGALAILTENFSSNGGELLINEVANIQKQNDRWKISAGNTEYSSTDVVICTGPWTNEVLKPLGYRFPLLMKRGYHQHFHAHEKLTYSIVDCKYGYLMTSMEEGVRITTGAEITNRTAKPNPVQIKLILPKANELFELGEPAEPKAWVGSRPCFTDSLPVIDRAEKHEGLWFNFGHGHVGLTTGPASGRLMAEMICGEKTFCDPAPYSATRF